MSKHLNRFYLTPGVITMAEKYRAFWLIDAVASFTLLREFQQSVAERGDFHLFELHVEKGSNRALLKCSWDTDQVIIQQLIDYTDFPHPYIKLYLENGVLCLPEDR